MDTRTKPVDSSLGLLVGGSLIYIYAFDIYSTGGGCGGIFDGGGGGFDGGGLCYLLLLLLSLLFYD